MKTYWFLYVPAILFFALPIINLIYQSAKASAAAKAKEEQRRRDAEIKQVQQAAKQAARERAAKMKKAVKEKPAGSETKRKPGRPRKNTPIKRAETISKKQEAKQKKAAPLPTKAPDRQPEKAAPLPTKAPDRQLEKAAPLPTSCTLEQFAAWIG